MVSGQGSGSFNKERQISIIVLSSLSNYRLALEIDQEAKNWRLNRLASALAGSL